MKIDVELHKIKKDAETFVSDIDKSVFDFKNNPFSFFGKGVRSRFTMLFSASLGVKVEKARKIALWSELVHTASLLHDDCVDGAYFRRGELTINAKLGVNTAILLGDLIMGKVFSQVNNFSGIIAMNLAETVTKMSEGALMEEGCKYSFLDVSDYEKIVSLKTSSVFRWIGLSLVFLSQKRFFEEAATISESFGLSFQIIDDALDIEEGIKSGKDKFKDISEGKLTLPFILAMENKELADFLQKGVMELSRNNVKDFSLIYEMAKKVEENGFIEKSREKAKRLIENIEPIVLKLPEKREAKRFYDYLYSLSYRRS